jgi:hypothetical protein
MFIVRPVTKIVNYDRNTFIVQATDLLDIYGAMFKDNS